MGTGHTYTTTVVEATCIAAGYTLHECECGDSYQSDGVAALGHNYKNSVCTRCGQESLFGPGITKPTFPSLPGIGNSSMLSANGQVLEATIVQIYDYVYNGGSLTQMTVTTTVDGEEASIDTLYFAYASGTPMSVTYNDEVYYYVTNLQGDVTALLDTDGVMVVEYTYDAWGNPLSITGDLADTLGQANPLRYRGYVYDTETGLYYLQSRYYDPELGRFLNADSLASTGQGLLGNNMFAYCLNNPIVYSDFSGKTTVLAENIPLVWASTMWWLCCVDAFLPVTDIVYATGFLVLTAVCATTMTGSQATTEAKAEVMVMAVTAGDNPATYYTVYFLCRADDPERAIIYVGRVLTSNYRSRMVYHAMKGRQEVARIDNLTYEECRFVEQAGMVYFHTIGRGETYKNQIRGISPLNVKRFTYIEAGNLLTFNRLPEEFIFPHSYFANLNEETLLNGGL